MGLINEPARYQSDQIHILCIFLESVYFWWDNGMGCHVVWPSAAPPFLSPHAHTQSNDTGGNYSVLRDSLSSRTELHLYAGRWHTLSNAIMSHHVSTQASFTHSCVFRHFRGHKVAFTFHKQPLSFSFHQAFTLKSNDIMRTSLDITSAACHPSFFLLHSHCRTETAVYQRKQEDQYFYVVSCRLTCLTFVYLLINAQWNRNTGSKGLS